MTSSRKRLNQGSNASKTKATSPKHFKSNDDHDKKSDHIQDINDRRDWDDQHDRGNRDLLPNREEYLSQLRIMLEKIKKEAQETKYNQLSAALADIYLKLKANQFSGNQITLLSRLLGKHYIENGFLRNSKDANITINFSKCADLLFNQLNNLCKKRNLITPWKNPSNLQFKLNSLAYLIYYLGIISEFSDADLSPDHLGYLLNQSVEFIKDFKKVPKDKIIIRNDGTLVIPLNDLIFLMIDGTGNLVKHMISSKLSSDHIPIFTKPITQLMRLLELTNPFEPKNLKNFFYGLVDLTTKLDNIEQNILPTDSLKFILENLSQLPLDDPLNHTCIFLNLAGRLVSKKQLLTLSLDAEKIINTPLENLFNSGYKIGMNHVVKILSGVSNLIPIIHGKINVKLFNDLLKVEITQACLKKLILYQVTSLIKADKLSGPLDINKINKLENSDDFVEKVLDPDDMNLYISNTIKETFNTNNPKTDMPAFNQIYNHLQNKTLSVQQISLLAQLLKKNLNKFIIKDQHGKTNETLEKKYADFVLLLINQITHRCDQDKFNAIIRETTKKTLRDFYFEIFHSSIWLYNIGYISMKHSYYFPIRNIEYLLQHIAMCLERSCNAIPMNNCKTKIDISISFALLSTCRLLNPSISNKTRNDAVIVHIHSLTQGFLGLLNISVSSVKIALEGLTLLKKKMQNPLINKCIEMLNNALKGTYKPSSQVHYNANNLNPFLEENNSINIDMAHEVTTAIINEPLPESNNLPLNNNFADFNVMDFNSLDPLFNDEDNLFNKEFDEFIFDFSSAEETSNPQVVTPPPKNEEDDISSVKKNNANSENTNQNLLTASLSKPQEKIISNNQSSIFQKNAAHQSSSKKTTEQKANFSQNKLEKPTTGASHFLNYHTNKKRKNTNLKNIPVKKIKKELTLEETLERKNLDNLGNFRKGVS